MNCSRDGVVRCDCRIDQETCNDRPIQKDHSAVDFNPFGDLAKTFEQFKKAPCQAKGAGRPDRCVTSASTPHHSSTPRTELRCLRFADALIHLWLARHKRDSPLGIPVAGLRPCQITLSLRRESSKLHKFAVRRGDAEVCRQQ